MSKKVVMLSSQNSLSIHSAGTCFRHHGARGLEFVFNTMWLEDLMDEKVGRESKAASPGAPIWSFREGFQHTRHSHVFLLCYFGSLRAHMYCETEVF